MRSRKTNLYLAIGVFIFGLTLTMDRFIGLPEFIHGMGLGAAILLELLDAYAYRHDITQLRKVKFTLVRKIFRAWM